MTTITAPRRTTRRFRTSTVLVTALTVVGIGTAAVVIPRLTSTEHTSPPKQTAHSAVAQSSRQVADSPGGSTYLSQVPAAAGALVGHSGPAHHGVVRTGTLAETHQYGSRANHPGTSQPQQLTTVPSQHRTGASAERSHNSRGLD